MRSIAPSMIRTGAVILGIKLLLIIVLSLALSEARATWWTAVMLGLVGFLNVSAISAVQRGDRRDIVSGSFLTVPVTGAIAVILSLMGPESWIATAFYWIFQFVVAILVLYWYWQFQALWSTAKTVRGNQ